MVRILVALAACVAIACVLAQQPTPQQQPAAVQLQRGIYAQSTAGDLDSAIQEYRAIVASNHSQRAVAAQAQYRLAQALLQKGNLTAAAQEFQILASNYGDYEDLIKSMASVNAAVRVSQTAPIGTFENGRFHHNLTGIEFNAPAGWQLAYQSASSGQCESVGFKDPVSGVEVSVWMRPEHIDAQEIDNWLDFSQARKHLDREDGWTLRSGSTRRTVGGQKALSATADISGQGQQLVELMNWVASTNCFAQFWGQVPVDKVSILQNALDQVMSSAKIP